MLFIYYYINQIFFNYQNYIIITISFLYFINFLKIYKKNYNILVIFNNFIIYI